MPLAIESMRKQEDIDLKVITYNESKDSAVQVLPKYYARKSYEKIYQHLSKTYKSLNYLEIYAIKNNIDVIHIQDSYLFNKVSSLFEFQSEDRPKIVLTMRGAETYTKPWVFKKWKLFYRDYYKKIDAYIVMSNHQKQYLHEKWGVALSKIKVIPISFGAAFYQEPKVPNKSVIKIASVFRLYWAKNITDNLKFIKGLKDKGLQVEYDIYGSGPDVEQIFFLRDKYGLNKEVKLIGKLENTILKEKLANYDFILQLSITESLGMSVIEAQAYGLPGIVSHAGGLPEVVVDGETGFVFKNYEATVAEVINLWKNPDRYKCFSQRAIEHSHKKFSIDREVADLVALYKTLF